MASYRGHLFTSTALGIAYTGASILYLNVDWPIAAVGGLLTAAGGLLPDLDSDSGVPVREMTHITAALAPILLLRRLAGYGLSQEQTFLACAGIYCFIRFILFRMFRKITVHRGMYHSIPAMLIAGLVIFLAFDHPDTEVRAFLAVGVMIGFLSHLVLDELCSVDINGVVPKLNHFAGTAVKFYSPSKSATLFTYAILFTLGYIAWGEVQATPGQAGSLMAHINELKQRTALQFQERPQSGKLRPAPANPKESRPPNIPLNVP